VERTHIKAACLVSPVKARFCSIVIKDRGACKQYVSPRKLLCGSAWEEGMWVGVERRGGSGGESMYNCAMAEVCVRRVSHRGLLRLRLKRVQRTADHR